ncbi:syntaphilin isoform X2 [Nelusetta ayraudi]|uniref:syntaphilin isoform X2 n=1 Tax=Nelusetta ayraudi TaxID=303726 RepID=UPI003F72089C
MRSVGTSGRQSDTSSVHSHPSRVRVPEGSPTARTNPSTPRRQVKYTGCSDNHGIRTPKPEQYLTPLQQKEVCIRHLRARLRDNVERLHHRDYEIDELRNQLYRMQEDWIEEECHRVEAQLALKEARKEIQHLQEVVESVRSSLSVREQDPHVHKPFPGLQGAKPGGRSRSCGCSPASTLSRGATTWARRSNEALQLEAGRGSRPGQTHLLLEAALLSEPPPLAQPGPGRGHPAVSRSPSACERLCSGGAVLPVSHSCHALSSSSTCTCSGHAYLPHHHLFLHLPQEEAPATLAAEPGPAPYSSPSPSHCPTPSPCPAPSPAPAVDRRPEVRSQACSPTMTWLCEDDDPSVPELSVVSIATVDLAAPPPGPAPTPAPLPLQPTPLTRLHCFHPDTSDTPLTSQPLPSTPLPARQEATAAESEGEGAPAPPPPSHWSRYFLVDLLALAIPVVPTMAWLCRGAPQEVVPVYHIGSLLRGCCAVALHSLRRRSASRGRRSASVNGAAPS